jgi:uncharacterized protein YfkK (UPF0435 family)
MKKLDLTNHSAENIEYMVEKIKEKLRLMNFGVISAESFNVEAYDDLKDLFDMVQKKAFFSPSEMQAITVELGNLRKK